MADGAIDQLHFEIVLNDAKFGQQIKNDIEKAKELNSSLTKILDLKNKINNTARGSYLDEQKMAQAAAKTAEAKAKQALQEQKVRTEVEKTALAQERARKAAVANGNAVKGLPGIWGNIAARVVSVTMAIRLFARTIVNAIKNISSFQQANANLATIMQVTRREIDVLTNDALMLGRTTEWTASQVTELQTALAKLGYNIPQIRNMQASVLQFATAVGAKLPEAANLAGASLRMFGMHSTEMQKALEILTASTNKTALDFEKLKVSLPYVGAIAHSLGMDIAQTASMLGVLTNAGLESSRAGTGLRQVLLELSKQGGKLQTARGGNIKTFDDFVRGLEGMRNRGLDAGEATKLVSTRAASALLILANGVDDIKRLNEEVRDTDGLLKTIQQDRLDTLHGSTLLLKSAWEGLIQSFRDSAGPMKDVVDWLTKIVRAASLAVSTTNRIAQGTKKYQGSDAMTKEYTEMFGRLVSQGHSIEEATRLVREQMINKLNIIDQKTEADSKNFWQNAGQWAGRMFAPLAGPLAPQVIKSTTKGTQSNIESAIAVKEAMAAVMDYIANFSKESAEIAANNYLEEWKLVFDTQGAEAARAAARAVTGYDAQKQKLEEYILAGGLAGINDRATVSGSDAEKEHRDRIARLKEDAAQLKKLADAYEKLEPYLGKGTESKMAELFGERDYSRESLEEQIRKISAALRDLGEDGKAVAESIENTWGLDELSVTLKRLDIAKDAKKLAEDAQKVLWSYKPAPGLAKKTTQQSDQFDPKKWREIAKQARYIASQFLSVANSLKTFADASGNQALSDAASRLGAIAETLKEVGNGYRQGGVWGAVAGGIASVLQQIIDGMTAAEQEAAKLRDIVRDIRQETENESFKNAMVDGVDGIFGENALRRLKNAVSLLGEVRKDLAALKYEQPEWSFLGWKDEELPDVYRAQAVREGKYGEMPFVTNHSWLAGDTTRTLEELANEFNLAMRDENGFLNPKLLQAILDNYGELNQGAVDWLTDSIRLAGEYSEALKQVEESTKAMFGNIASQAADEIVEGWIAAGDAALDYADILDDVAKAYSKMLIQSVIMETVLDPITEDLKKAFMDNRYEDAMAMVANAMQTIEASAPVYEQILRAFDPYFNRSETTGSGGGLGSGIKSITEETASLLASYINAIRADVSYIRVMYERGLEHMTAFGSSLPTLNDHIAQIAATNFDIAQSNQSILSELRSVIGPVGTSGMVVRVEAS